MHTDQMTDAGDMASLLLPSEPLDTSVQSSSLGGRMVDDNRMSPLPMTPSSDLSATLRSENRLLKSRLRQLQSDLQAEHDSVSSLRKRLNASEKERLDIVVKSGEEISQLDSEVTRLRAQLERGEAVRQNLEFELAKSNRVIGQEKRNASDRESSMSEKNTMYKQQNAELCQQIDLLTKQLSESKVSHDEQARQHCRAIDAKDKQLSDCRCEFDLAEVEKERAILASLQKDSVISELEEKVKQLQADLQDAMENTGRHKRENEALEGVEARQKAELEAAMERINVLENNIEAERAAHLESKFNSEIVQLRIRDLENALQLEKTNKSDALANSDSLNQKLRDLQHAYEEERQCCLATKNRLENSWKPLLRAEREYDGLSKQLRQELDDKKVLIGKLSTQLDKHQKNFDELKQELNKAKKRQSQLEDTYHGCMRDLNVLLHTYDGSSISKNAKKEPSKTLSPALLLDGLGRLLLSNQKRLQASATELKKANSQKAQLAEECNRYKDLISEKDRAIKVAQQGLSEASRERKRIVTEKKQQSVSSKRLEADLLSTSQQITAAEAKIKQLTEQLQKITAKNKTDEQVVVCYLQGLHQQLLSAVAMPIQPATATFGDLSTVLSEQVASVLTSLQSAHDKVLKLEGEVKRQHTAEVELRRSFEAQIEQLAGATDGQIREWQQERLQLQEQYSQVLVQAQSRHKKSQTEAEQALERARNCESQRVQLESELGRLRADALLSLRERRGLLAACAILSGALYPLKARIARLVSERRLMACRLSRLDAFVQRVTLLVDTLQLDQVGMKVKGQSTALARFRVGTIAVMAANRLSFLLRARSHACMFTTRDACAGNMAVYVGGTESPQATFTGVSAVWPANGARSEQMAENTISWLASSKLLVAVMTSVCDLETILQKAGQDADLDLNDVIPASSDAYDRLQRCLQPMFMTVDMDAGSRPDSLLHRLTPHVRSSPYADNLEQLVSWMTNAVGMADKLDKVRATEKELRAELAWALREREAVMERKEQQMDEFVSRDKFEVLCEEQANSLQRELQAQKLLGEQAARLHDLSVNLDAEVKAKVQREQELSAVRRQCDTHADTVRQLKQQVSVAGNDTKQLKRNIADAETALRTAAKDREALGSYMKMVLEELEKLRVAISSGSEAPFADLLSMLPSHSGRAAPELTACQTLVAAFVETHRQQGALITTLRADVETYRQHAVSLKSELSAACRRQYGEELDNLKDIAVYPDIALAAPAAVPIASLLRSAHPAGGGDHVDEFAPLQEDVSEYFDVPQSMKQSNADSGLAIYQRRHMVGGFGRPHSRVNRTGTAK